MNRIVKFTRCMRELLISKRKLFGQLYDITSKTEETSLFIDELTQAIVDIFKKCNIPIAIPNDRQKDRKSISRKRIVVQYYNYLLLNTCFPSQDFLKMDLLYNHKVNMLPNISPYLFIQIIWRLEYEEVLVESLQYMPLDLCAEILDITINKCLVELKSERAISLIFSFISRIYCKCLWLDWNVHLKNNVKEYLYQLVAYFQMLLDLLDKFNHRMKKKRCNEEKTQEKIREKYKHHGTFLKRILRYTRLCMCKKLSSNLINPGVTYVADMYRLTFGNLEIYHKLTNYEINSIMIMLDRELVTLLLKEIQEIDYFEYMCWAEIEDEKNAKFSLQYVVAIECYKFIKYMKRDDFLVENDHLRQLLQQLIHWSNFSSVNSKNFNFTTLQVLRASIVNGESNDMRKLMKRYKEWDELTVNFISDRMYSLKQDDIFFLLEYLHHVFANSLDATERNKAYVSILTMLQQVDEISLHLIVLKYTKRHFHNNYLECMYDDKVFHKFINNKIDINNPLHLHVLLIYILLNAKKVLTILIKIVIGYSYYKKFTFTEDDLLTLRQFLCIKVDEEYNLLLVILKEVCFNNSQWNASKLCDLMAVMSDSKVIKSDDVINYFYIPYLITTDIDYFEHLEIGMQFIETELRFPRKINYILLIVALTKKMSLIRRNAKCMKKEADQVLSTACYLLYKIQGNLKTRTLAEMARKLREYNIIGNWLEPLDRAQMLMVIAPNDIDVLQVIQDYETRCFPIHQRMRMKNPLWVHNKRFRNCARINLESLIRHMMVRATESEFKSYVYDLTKLYYHFGWTSQLEAYENLVRIATEAIQLAIVYSKSFHINTSITLLHTLVKFCKMFAKKSNAHSYEAICHISLLAFFSLQKFMNCTQYGKLYNYILIQISNMFADKSYTNMEHFFRDIQEWMQICFGRYNNNGRVISFKENFESTFTSNDETNSRARDNKLFNMFNEYNFVCDCITILNIET